jgi:hypothetical protein
MAMCCAKTLAGMSIALQFYPPVPPNAMDRSY